MICPNDKREMMKEYLLDYIIHKCNKCGHRKITDYDGKEISGEKRRELEDIYGG